MDDVGLRLNERERLRLRHTVNARTRPGAPDRIVRGHAVGPREPRGGEWGANGGQGGVLMMSLRRALL